MTTKTKTLAMILASGIAVPAAVESVAHAQSATATVTEVIPSPTLDKAPINNGRLKRTDEEQEGNGMPTAAMFEDNKNGLYFSMNTELPATTAGGPVRGATHRMQLAAVPLSLAQDATGKVMVTADATKGTFVTNNDGNEYRNANSPVAFKLFGGKLIGVKYNYQPNNTNNTAAYIQIFNQAGVPVLKQTEMFAKNNDDCFMTQDGDFLSAVQKSATETRVAFYAGCNGNGNDDGWAVISDIKCDAGLTSCTYARAADVSINPREERSRGKCSVGTDPNTAICTWTEGNTQPQRDGVWMAAVNIGDGQNGQNAQNRIKWKKQIAGRVDGPDGERTYAMRMSHSRIQKVNPTTGLLENTDDIIVRWGGLQGNNNTNGKGGTYYTNMMGVYNATVAALTPVAEPVDVAGKLVGLDGTHLGMTFGLFGTTDALTPGITFLGGSHTGGGASAQARVITYNPTTKEFAEGAMMAIAPHDRHLYPNYLGNNPGNQGRNHSWSTMVVNPFVGQNGNTDAYLQLFATSGKSAATMSDPARKLSAFISVLPIAQTPKVVVQPGGGSGSGSGSGSGDGDGNGDGDGTTDGGTSLGGCSTGGSTTGGAFGMLLVGMAALIRRRR